MDALTLASSEEVGSSRLHRRRRKAGDTSPKKERTQHYENFGRVKRVVMYNALGERVTKLVQLEEHQVSLSEENYKKPRPKLPVPEIKSDRLSERRRKRLERKRLAPPLPSLRPNQDSSTRDNPSLRATITTIWFILERYICESLAIYENEDLLPENEAITRRFYPCDLAQFVDKQFHLQYGSSELRCARKRDFSRGIQAHQDRAAIVQVFARYMNIVEDVKFTSEAFDIQMALLSGFFSRDCLVMEESLEGGLDCAPATVKEGEEGVMDEPMWRGVPVSDTEYVLNSVFNTWMFPNAMTEKLLEFRENVPVKSSRLCEGDGKDIVNLGELLLYACEVWQSYVSQEISLEKRLFLLETSSASPNHSLESQEVLMLLHSVLHSFMKKDRLRTGCLPTDIFKYVIQAEQSQFACKLSLSEHSLQGIAIAFQTMDNNDSICYLDFWESCYAFYMQSHGLSPSILPLLSGRDRILSLCPSKRRDLLDYFNSTSYAYYGVRRYLHALRDEEESNGPESSRSISESFLELRKTLPGREMTGELGEDCVQKGLREEVVDIRKLSVRPVSRPSTRAKSRHESQRRPFGMRETEKQARDVTESTDVVPNSREEIQLRLTISAPELPVSFKERVEESSKIIRKNRQHKVGKKFKFPNAKSRHVYSGDQMILRETEELETVTSHTVGGHSVVGGIKADLPEKKQCGPGNYSDRDEFVANSTKIQDSVSATDLDTVFPDLNRADKRVLADERFSLIRRDVAGKQRQKRTDGAPREVRKVPFGAKGSKATRFFLEDHYAKIPEDQKNIITGALQGKFLMDVHANEIETGDALGIDTSKKGESRAEVETSFIKRNKARWNVAPKLREPIDRVPEMKITRMDAQEYAGQESAEAEGCVKRHTQAESVLSLLQYQTASVDTDHVSQDCDGCLKEEEANACMDDITTVDKPDWTPQHAGIGSGTDPCTEPEFGPCSNFRYPESKLCELPPAPIEVAPQLLSSKMLSPSYEVVPPTISETLDSENSESSIGFAHEQSSRTQALDADNFDDLEALVVEDDLQCCILNLECRNIIFSHSIELERFYSFTYGHRRAKRLLERSLRRISLPISGSNESGSNSLSTSDSEDEDVLSALVNGALEETHI